MGEAPVGDNNDNDPERELTPEEQEAQAYADHKADEAWWAEGSNDPLEEYDYDYYGSGEEAAAFVQVESKLSKKKQLQKRVWKVKNGLKTNAQKEAKFQRDLDKVMKDFE